MKYPKYLLLLLLCLLLTACGPKPAEAVTLDLDYIADTLTASGYFPEPLEAQDPELVPGLLNLYEDRIEANPEDIAQARYTMSLGMVADQFLLLEGADGEAAGHLEKALKPTLRTSGPPMSSTPPTRRPGWTTPSWSGRATTCSSPWGATGTLWRSCAKS